MPAEATEKAQPDHPELKVIKPDSRFSAGPITSARNLAAELFRYRSHILTLFSNDFKASYRGTTFGIIWNFILPLVPISVYLLLISIRVFPAYDGMEPALFLAFNVMLWYLFTGLVLTPINVVKSKAATSMKTSLPLSVAIASSFAQICFDTLVRLALVIALIVFFRDWPVPNLVGLIVVMMTSIIFCLSVGLLLSIINMAYTDIQRIVAILLQYGLFLSGVIFPMSSMGILAILEPWNPFAVFIAASRSFLFEGVYLYQGALAWWAAGSVLLLVIAIRFFYLMEQRVRGLS